MSRFQTSQQQKTSGSPQKASGKYDDPIQGTCNQKTHLFQVYSNHPTEGPRLISTEYNQGVPLLVIVDQPCCCYCKLNVPHGIVTVEQKCGRKTGVLEPGYHCCYCNCNKIAAMISKNTIRFNHPIEKCPTKDNVVITIDIAINFHIGREEEELRTKDCETFLYSLGANRLQELLEQELDEKVRMLVRKHHVRAVSDLKSEMAHEILDDLSGRLNQFGVYFESVTIMNIIIPRDLRLALSNSTTYDVLLQNQIKFQENTKLKLNNSQNIELLKLKRNNMKKLDILNHNKAMEEITLEQEKILAITKQKEAIIKAEQEKSVKIIKAAAIKSQAESRAKKQQEAILAEARVYAIAKRIEADNQAGLLTQKAFNRLECAKLNSQALIVEADAEEQSSQNLLNKRKQTEKMLMSVNMTKMVAQNKMIVSGKIGEDFLNFFKDTVDLVQSKAE